MTLDINFSFYVPPPPAPLPRPVPYSVITVPNDGRRYVRLVEDYKTGDNTDWGGLPRPMRKGDGSPLPAVVPTEKIFYPLNEPWQKFQYELCREFSFNFLTEADMLFSYKRTFRDSGGSRDRHTFDDIKNIPPHLHTDHILKMNMDSGYGDASLQDLVWSRNILRVIREDARWIYYETLNHTMFETPWFDTSPVRLSGGRIKHLINPPAVKDVIGKWWLVGLMIQSTIIPIEGARREWRHTRWPYFGGFGCPYLVVGRNGVNKVEKYWCEDVANGVQLPAYT